MFPVPARAASRVSACVGPRVARSGGLARRRQSGMARPSNLPVRGKNALIAGGTVNTAIWLLFVQALLGAFDTLYYHEYRLRLPHGHGAKTELRLHAARDFAYAVIIGSLGFLTWNGWLAWVLCALLLVEIVITIWDFVEEDRVRRLPAGERAMHAVMGIVYGAFLAYLVPDMLRWSTE